MMRMTKGKTPRIVFHILVWIVFIILPVFLVKRYRMASDFMLTYYTFAAISALIFYINYIFLVPKLFFKKKKYRYYISALVLVSCFYFISGFANGQINNWIARNDSEQAGRQINERSVPRQPPRRPGIIIALPNARLIGYASYSLFLVFLSLSLRLLERQEEMEKTKLNAELAILKNQISPHFFFNTLNNIYSLIGRNNEDSKDAVIKLSKLMRYVLNESGQDTKLLKEEIEFMNNYIDLMKLRIGSKTRLEINFPGECKDLKIPHLLFISLIENAFKYGISVQEESYVNISLECGEHNVSFKCENGLPEGNTGTILSSSGIGLANLKKRLNLIYPGRHKLKIDRSSDKYEVNLNIRL
jgi:hypothetical protein